MGGQVGTKVKYSDRQPSDGPLLEFQAGFGNLYLQADSYSPDELPSCDTGVMLPSSGNLRAVRKIGLRLGLAGGN